MDKKWVQIKNELDKKMTPSSFSQWITPLKPLKYSKLKKTLVILVPEKISLDILEKRYIDQITEIVSEVYGEKIEVILCLPEDSYKYTNKKINFSPFDDDISEEVLVDPRQTFETFVVGENNRFAKAMSIAVAEAPGKSYNPLFIYGGSGLGKTHLLHAIGHYIKVNKPKMKVLYVSSVMFMEDFIKSIRNEKMNDFKIKYRNIDILLLDDIQFIDEKKTSTREEVFHTYNTLRDNGKQLVFSSDRPPKDLLGLDERLSSRLSEGLVVDIQPPSFETKVAILLNKANMDGIEFTDGLEDVIELIADKSITNIRDMKGAFNKVIAYSSFSGRKINKELACEVLKDIITAKDAQPTPEAIKKKVSNFYDIKLSDLESGSRARNFSFPRHVAMYLCRNMTDLSLPKIGMEFGGKDHTTVMHACDKIEKEKNINETLFNNLEELEKQIKNI